MSLIWSRTEANGRKSVTIVFPDGEVVTVGAENPALNDITLKLAAEAPESEIRALLSPAEAIVQRFRSLSDRITTDGLNLFVDGDVIHDALADYILKLVRLETEGNGEVSYLPFVNFLEKLTQNPSADSRNSLYDFIQRHGLTIMPDGDFVAYKGVQADFGSISTGPGIVNGIKRNGHLPNKPGSTLWVERSYVDSDRQRGCSVGLHAGTRQYASSWSGSVGRVVAVAINPRDVVSVPTDHDFQKIRTARYTVLHEVAKEFTPTTAATVAPLYGARKPRPDLSSGAVAVLKEVAHTGEVVTINYTPLWGAAKDYRVRVERVDVVSIKVVSERSGRPLTFLFSGINSVTRSEKIASEKAADVADKVIRKVDDVVKVLSKAIKKGRSVVFDYYTSDGSTREFTVTPRSIIENAAPLLKIIGDPRTFRLDKIVSVDVVDAEAKKSKKAKKKGKKAKNKRDGNVVTVTVSGESKKK